jgi:hypothetical protein
MKNPTQKERILAYLLAGKVLTRLNSWDTLGVLEAPARISELRKAGWSIETRMVTVQNRFHDDVRVAEWRYAAEF